jgi:hypothetical protein
VTNTQEVLTPLAHAACRRGARPPDVVRTSAVVVDERFAVVTFQAHYGDEDGPAHVWGADVFRLWKRETPPPD